MSIRIKEAVDEVVKHGDTRVTRPLAAFVTRMVAYRSGSTDPAPTLRMDAHLPATISEYLASDHPSAVTVRMQAAFDAAYYESHQTLEEKRRNRSRRLTELEDILGSSVAYAALDLPHLATTYRRLFEYVVAFWGPRSVNAHVSELEAANKEITAAMESVFPKVGLKQFVALSKPEKVGQMAELAHLVMGIRIFNWSLGKGGAGIEDVAKLTMRDAVGLQREIDTALLHSNELVAQYVDVLFAIRCGALSTPVNAANWPSELLNRKQLSVYLSSISNEMATIVQALEVAAEAFDREIQALQEVVGPKSSVPKEQVYPHFHNVAAYWLQMKDIRDNLSTLLAVHRAISPFVPPYVVTMPQDVVRAGRQVTITELPAHAHPVGRAVGDVDGPAQLLSLDHSDEFLQTPLAFQGFCPVSLVTPVAGTEDTKLGICIPGNPSIGVVRWRDMHFVCSSQQAVKIFVDAPRYCYDRIILLAKHHLELVHLIQLTASDQFPEASLPLLIQYGGDLAAASHAIRSKMLVPLANAVQGTAEGGPVRLSKLGVPLKDAGTETPTHFVERHVDKEYEWNEWALRRRALKIITLRQSRTTSGQTDGSHFRRDNDTQVYLPKDNGTQTGISVGTTTWVAPGLSV